MSADARNYRILDEVHGVGGTRVLGLAIVVIVRRAGGGIQGDVLQHAAEAERVPDLRFVLFRKLDAFGVASAFEVENPVGAPAMLVVANKVARGIGRQRGFTGAREPEEWRAHTVAANIGRAVHG